MANYVLVAGAWLGAWAWDDVVPHLHAAGHGAYPVTLSGLGERKRQPAGQRTHVQDVVDEVERRGLSDVVLVGHSYSGIPVGQAAERIGDRLNHAVFVDSEVPSDGISFADRWWQGRHAFEETLAGDGGSWAPLTLADCEGQGLTGEQSGRLVSGATPHPGASLTEPAEMRRPVGELPATYVKCLLDGPEPSEYVAASVSSGGWEYAEMDTGHWPMFSAPDDLARILLRPASRA
ncbi:alpha/beta fold hydrolase [Streptomyces sp. NPDC057428]|uniref:alpha/beta fold hydrolase n=1 Tax=Streptomyces sp. NPDC057428 TaxID=3346129 RepID=UPI0036A2EB06